MNKKIKNTLEALAGAAVSITGFVGGALLYNSVVPVVTDYDHLSTITGLISGTYIARSYIGTSKSNGNKILGANIFNVTGIGVSSISLLIPTMFHSFYLGDTIAQGAIESIQQPFWHLAGVISAYRIFRKKTKIIDDTDDDRRDDRDRDPRYPPGTGGGGLRLPRFELEFNRRKNYPRYPAGKV